MRRILLSLLLAATLIHPARAALNCPENTMRIIIPFSAGSATDVQNRVIADKLASMKELGVNFIVVNRDGAYGRLAVKAVVGARPEDCIIGSLNDGPMATMVANDLAWGRPLMYDPLTDLRPIGFVTRTIFVVVVTNEVPIHSLAEMVKYSQANPEKLMFASPHPSGKLGIAQLNAAGAKIFEVPYRGEPAAYTDLFAGRVQGIVSTMYLARQYEQSGKVRILATLSGTRPELLPDVPTVAEAGYPDLASFPSWAAFFGPKNLPDNTVRVIGEALPKALSDPSVRERLAPMGGTYTSTPEEVTKVVREQIEAMRKFMKTNNLQLE